LKKKHYYVLWSGGIDSTFLIDKLLKDGHKVSAGYVEITNNPNKDKIELEAIIKLYAKIKVKYPEFRFNDTIARYDMYLTPVQLAINQPLFWLMSTVVCVPWECDSIAVGFIQKDDALSFLPEIQAAYKAMGKLRRDPLPKLEFPLIKHSKSEIYTTLDHSLVELCSFCETPNVVPDTAPCGHCNKCTEMKRFIEYGWVTDHWFSPRKKFDRSLIEDESEDAGEILHPAERLLKLEDMDELTQEELRKAKLKLRDRHLQRREESNLILVDKKLSDSFSSKVLKGKLKKIVKTPIKLGIKSMRDA